MTDWSVELYQKIVPKLDLAIKFNQAFPQRNINFFETAIDSVDDKNSKLYILKVGNDIKGGFFSYKVFGFEDDVWSPSYLFVDKEFRYLSLMLFEKMSKFVINVSPTDDLKKILMYLEYQPINLGSFLIPVLCGIINLFPSSNKIKLSPELQSPFIEFNSRKDLIWFSYEVNGKSYFTCIKKTSRHGVPFFVLVYFHKLHIKYFFSSLLFLLFRVNPLSILIVPNFGFDYGYLSIKSNKFHAFSNFKHADDFYSILGSEVTEVI